MPLPDLGRDDAMPGSVLTATLLLRFGQHRMGGRVYWPKSTAADTAAPLTFVPTVADRGNVDSLCRALCSAADTVVLAVPSPRGARQDYELAALGWIVEHAAELDAQTEHLMVAGEGAGGARAARLTICARDNGWPQLCRQVLVYPTFTQACPMPSLLVGVPPATVISSDTGIDDGSTYAARLRASDIDVDELRCPTPILPGHDDLSTALTGRSR
jgi:acetyl esterase/lipase